MSLYISFILCSTAFRSADRSFISIRNVAVICGPARCANFVGIIFLTSFIVLLRLSLLRLEDTYHIMLCINFYPNTCLQYVEEFCTGPINIVTVIISFIVLIQYSTLPINSSLYIVIENLANLSSATNVTQKYSLCSRLSVENMITSFCLNFYIKD